jgi:hypothetical protein
LNSTTQDLELVLLAVVEHGGHFVLCVHKLEPYLFGGVKQCHLIGRGTLVLWFLLGLLILFALLLLRGGGC